MYEFRVHDGTVSSCFPDTQHCKIDLRGISENRCCAFCCGTLPIFRLEVARSKEAKHLMVRFKKRWILGDLYFGCNPASIRSAKLRDSITTQDILQSILDSVDENFGTFGSGKVARQLKVDLYRPSLGTFIVQCSSSHFNTLSAAFFFVTTIKDQPVTFRILHAGGTLAQTKKAFRDILLEWVNEATLAPGHFCSSSSAPAIRAVYEREYAIIDGLTEGDT